jgi:hypothetical protein
VERTAAGGGALRARGHSFTADETGRLTSWLGPRPRRAEPGDYYSHIVDLIHKGGVMIDRDEYIRP